MPHVLRMDFEYKFALLGISCHERDYRLGWFINNALHFSMEKQDPLVIRQKNGDSFHSFFSYIEPEDHVNVSFLTNRGEGGYILPEYQQFDYLFKLEEIGGLTTGDFQQVIRRIPIVLGAYEIEVDRLKSKENLLF